MDNKDFSGRKLTDVFKELEQARYSYEQENLISDRKLRNKTEKKKDKISKVSNISNIKPNKEKIKSVNKVKLSKKAINYYSF